MRDRGRLTRLDAALLQVLAIIDILAIAGAALLAAWWKGWL